MSPERLAALRKTFGGMTTGELRAIAEGRKKTSLSEETLGAIRLLIAERKEGGPVTIVESANRPVAGTVTLTFHWAHAESALGQMLTKGGSRNLCLDGTPWVVIVRGGDAVRLSSTVGKHQVDFELSDGLMAKAESERFELNCKIPGDYQFGVMGKLRGTELLLTDPNGGTEILKSSKVATPHRRAGSLQQIGMALMVLSWVFYQAAKPIGFESVSRRTLFALCVGVACLGFGFVLVGRRKG